MIALGAEALDYGPDREHTLVRNLSFTLGAGQALHVRGANGVGKSLLARVLLGHHPAQAGKVTRGIRAYSYLPQTQNRASHLPYSIADILAFTGASAHEALALGLLEERHLALSWNKASGGERQRALLTQVFLRPEALLVLDEPFNHLDLVAKESVKKHVRAFLSSGAGRSLVLISHEETEVSWLDSVPVVAVDLENWRAK